ncbi:MAG: RiPP maturation radical SAM C-methyltransferase [Pseudomonadota bacterium]
MRVCLVSMPFAPANMPNLGVSTLKAALARDGIACDIYYGALDWIRFFLEPHTSWSLGDYDMLATYQDLGEVFCSGPLWGEGPAGMIEALDLLEEQAGPRFDLPDLSGFCGRARRYAARADAFIEHCLQRRDWGTFDVLGFSTSFCQSVASLCLARRIKERHPGVHVVFGGANTDGAMGQQLLRSFPWVDAIIQGEADHSFPEYLRRLRDGRETGGVCGLWTQGALESPAHPALPVADLDVLPIPDFADYFKQLPGLLRHPLNSANLAIPIETSRGCWWGAVRHCIFCGLNPTSLAYRTKSGDRVLKEVRINTRRFGLRSVCAVDNILSQRYFKEVLPALEGEGLTLFYETKSNLREAEVAQLARAGVRLFQPGIESLNSRLLDLMRKGAKGIRQIELLKWCVVHGLAPLWFYMYRFPGEPEEPYLEDLAIFPLLHHLPPPRSPNPVVIDRQSQLFVEQERYGLRNLRPAGFGSFAWRGLPREERENICYHFDADLPQGPPSYERDLWQGVLRWQRQHAAGARFFQFRGAASTLLVDTRFGRPVYTLLTDSAHLIHGLIRRGRARSSIERWWPTRAGAEPGLEDLVFAATIGSLGGELLEGPGEISDLDGFLETLRLRGAALFRDGRWLALAVDCPSTAEAEKLGLGALYALPGAPAQGSEEAASP